MKKGAYLAEWDTIRFVCRVPIKAILTLLCSLSLGLAWSGCSHTPEEEATDSRGTGNGSSRLERLRIQNLAQGQISSLKEEKREVIRTADAWLALWKAHTRRTYPELPAPKVDFSEKMVIAVAMGRQRTGGYAIRVAEVVRDLDRSIVRVRVEEREPAPDAMTTQQLTSPFHFVAVPKSDWKVRFGSTAYKPSSGNNASR